MVAATSAVLNPALGLWWGFPLAATAAISLVWPYRGSLIALATASTLLAITGLPAWGRQEQALSLALGAAGFLTGFLALTGRVGVAGAQQVTLPVGPDQAGLRRAEGSAASTAASMLAALALVAGIGGAGTLWAVLAGWVMIVPWIEMALGLVQTGLAFAVGAALSAIRPRGRVRLAIAMALIVSLLAFAPLVWMLFLAG